MTLPRHLRDTIVNEYGVADVHALRSFFVTQLVRSGANPRLVMNLARHSSSNMTIGIYTRLRGDEERAAVESLPALVDEPAAKATGTDGVVSRRLSEPVAQAGTFGPGDGPRPQPMVGATGFEPATSCTPSKRASQAAPRPDGKGHRL